MKAKPFCLTMLGMGLAVVLMSACSLKSPAPGGQQVVSGGAPASAGNGVAGGVAWTDQGGQWGDDARNHFYAQDQGSELIPLAWVRALKQSNNHPFLEDSLSRYGYLPNPDRKYNPEGLPVGFTAATRKGVKNLGLTCAACHTRQIEANGVAYRIDGGPAMVDVQSFLKDIDVGVGKLVQDESAFSAFSGEVLGPSASTAQKSALLKNVKDWYSRYHTITSLSLPTSPWGPSRLDAVSMIFNRVSGLDIGTTPDHMIRDNIKPADAPVRYPFIWNAAIQDQTQWTGFADNGNDILALARNLGEVYGVFANFHPEKKTVPVLGKVIDFNRDNSANFEGLQALEGMVRKMGPPKWPWAVDQALADKGKPIYDKECGTGCHEIKTGKQRHIDLTQKTWLTPIQDVGTDNRVYSVLARNVDTGVMSGAFLLSDQKKPDSLKPVDNAAKLLKAVVGGGIIEHYTPIKITGTDFSWLKGASMEKPASVKNYPNESRVLQGIWATAPYLHNGSVASLAELLKPAALRAKSFEVGPAYDPVNIGLAADQPRFGHFVYQTTDCNVRDSGNSRCGHEFGVDLSDADKKALLEYMKTL